MANAKTPERRLLQRWWRLLGCSAAFSSKRRVCCSAKCKRRRRRRRERAHKQRARFSFIVCMIRARARLRVCAALIKRRFAGWPTDRELARSLVAVDAAVAVAAAAAAAAAAAVAAAAAAAGCRPTGQWQPPTRSLHLAARLPPPSPPPAPTYNQSATERVFNSRAPPTASFNDCRRCRCGERAAEI